MNAPYQAGEHGQRHYICRRVVDALLREDVREMVSRGRIVAAAAAAPPPGAPQPSHWLAVEHLGGGCLWIPLRPGVFMQEWALHDLPLLWQEGGQWRRLDDAAELLALLGQGLEPETAAHFADYAGECRTAVEHAILCGAEQERFFAEVRRSGRRADLSPRWDERLLHYERLAAFLDHPLYPTARAKLGFTAEDLAAYGPEFQQPFALRWLAVPKDMHYGPEAAAALPGLCPSFADLGLDEGLTASHALLPVHPLTFAQLAQAGAWPAQCLPAPQARLEVLPTLSVRTVALRDNPALHLKLPLAIRTLGGRNLRTIKPSTIADGHTVQSLLGRIAAQDADIAGRLLLTDESQGTHVGQRPELGYILRSYPAGLEQASVVPVAGLLAAAPQGVTVAEQLAQRYCGGRLETFIDAYLETTLRLHLVLWLRYGIALESNQQNSLLVLSNGTPALRLLLKDNDACRIHGARLASRWPALAGFIEVLQDRRIVVEDELPLAQMFTTITLQLNVAVIVEGLAGSGLVDRRQLYAVVRGKIAALLAELARSGADTALARRVLLEEERQYAKYLLTAASLKPKAATGASDVNKFYGRSAPNFLKEGL